MPYTDSQRTIIRQFINYTQELKTISHMQMDDDFKSVHTFRATSIDLNTAGMEAVRDPKLLKDCEVFDDFITGGGIYMNGDEHKVRYEWNFKIKQIYDMNNKLHNIPHVIYYLYPFDGTNEFYFYTHPEKFEWDFRYIAVDDENYNVCATHKSQIPKKNWDNLDIIKKSTDIPKPEPKPKPVRTIECVICLDDCDATGGWECRTCNSGKVCKDCKAKCKGIKECPVCRTKPRYNKKKNKIT